MKVTGILEIAKQKRDQAGWERKQAAPPSKDPRIAHDCEVAAKTLDQEAEQLERMASDDWHVIENIEILIKHLAASSDKSAQRTLAMRDLESASSRLRRELGYQPINQ